MQRRARWRSPYLMLSCLLAMALMASGVTAQQSAKPQPEPAAKPEPMPTQPGKADSSPFLKAMRLAPHLEPVVQHPAWEKEANEKLAALLKEKGRRPNILIIYVDDMGWGDPGVYGGGPALGAPTPNMDSLAAAGLRMTSAYSQPACTPTRAAWQTGRLPQRTGLTRPTAAGEKSSGMAGETTIARILSDAGYKTGMAGKWHLGEAAGQWPTDVGYGEYYGNLGVNTSYHDWRDPNFSPELVYDPERVKAMEQVEFIRTTVKSWADDKPTEEPYSVDDPRTEYPEEINLETEPHLEMQYLDWSRKFMASAVQENKPFFLYHAMNRVHTKNYPNPDFVGKSPASTPFRDGIMEIDYVLGKLIEQVQRLKQEENTFIFFTSDNGAEEDVHAGGINTSDSGHQPWRGAKGTTWEGGVRVSGIAVWPGMIKAGRVSDGLFDHMDLFNTLMRLGLGEKASAKKLDSLSDRYIDGIDQTSWLLTRQDDQQESNREAIFYWYGQDFYGVRWAEFKRLERIMTIGMSVGPQTYGGLFNASKSETSDPSMGWFFNLYSDPKERMPITRTWNIATLNELSTRSKMTFVNYPQAPHGVILNGYILGGPAGGTVPGGTLAKLRDLLEKSRIPANALPD